MPPIGTLSLDLEANTAQFQENVLARAALVRGFAAMLRLAEGANDDEMSDAGRVPRRT